MARNEIDDKLESFIEAMYNASNIILERSPDFVLAPMNGSVPLIDAMAIVNSDFDPSKVVYMPASSRIENINDVITDWYKNFLRSNTQLPFQVPKVLGIDEVVSGGSVVRCLHSIDRAVNSHKSNETQNLVQRLISKDPDTTVQALNDMDNLTENNHAYELGLMKRKVLEGSYRQNPNEAKTDLSSVISIFKEVMGDRLTYNSIGIEDSKLEGRRNKEYQRLVNQGRITPVGVKTIITMDIPDFCPPRFVEKEVASGPGGYVRYLPEVQDFYVTPRYLDFLQHLARKVGKNPSEVNPLNMVPILESNKYLSGYKEKRSF